MEKLKEKAKEREIIVKDINENVENLNHKKPSYKSETKGNSKLIRVPVKKIIRIIRRKGPNDNINRINSICIDNKLRDEFFSDCKKSQHYANTKRYEIAYNSEEEETKTVYDKWDKLMLDIYYKELPPKSQEALNAKSTGGI